MGNLNSYLRSELNLDKIGLLSGQFLKIRINRFLVKENLLMILLLSASICLNNCILRASHSIDGNNYNILIIKTVHKTIFLSDEDGDNKYDIKIVRTKTNDIFYNSNKKGDNFSILYEYYDGEKCALANNSDKCPNDKIIIRKIYYKNSDVYLEVYMTNDIRYKREK